MPPQPLPVGRGEVLREGTDGVIWVIGTVARDALAAAERRADEGGQTWRSSMRV